MIYGLVIEVNILYFQNIIECNFIFFHEYSNFFFGDEICCYTTLIDPLENQFEVSVKKNQWKF
jgi:hypothetical protein